MTPLIREMVALAPDMAEQMHWFDCGTAPEGCKVGDASKGVVFKDYKIKEPT